jgi:hypothetical protein
MMQLLFIAITHKRERDRGKVVERECVFGREREREREREIDIVVKLASLKRE